MRAPRDQDAAIVAAGCVSALGYGLATTFAALDEGQSAVQPVPGADAATPPAARMDAPFLRLEMPREMEPQIKFLSGSGELAVEAAAEAVGASGLMESGIDAARRGMYLSQMDSDDWLCREFDAAMRTATEDFEKPLDQEAINRASARRVKPFFMLESLKNNAFSFLATLYALRGANTSVAGYAGPTHLALDMGVRSLARGSLDAVVVVGAARTTSAVGLAEMAAYGVTQPAGDGAGALVLRRVADVPAPRCVVLGLGSATHAVPPDHARPSVPALVDAAQQALTAAEVAPGDLRHIVVPGLGEEGLDAALAAVPALAGVPRTSWTDAWGHCGLAAETLQVALASAALQAGRMPGGEAWDAPGAILVLGAGLLGQASAAVLATV